MKGKISTFPIFVTAVAEWTMAILIAGVATLTRRELEWKWNRLIFWQIFFLCGKSLLAKEVKFIQIYRHLLAEWPWNIFVLYHKLSRGILKNKYKSFADDVKWWKLNITKFNVNPSNWFRFSIEDSAICHFSFTFRFIYKLLFFVNRYKKFTLKKVFAKKSPDKKINVTFEWSKMWAIDSWSEVSVEPRIAADNRRVASRSR